MHSSLRNIGLPSISALLLSAAVLSGSGCGDSGKAQVTGKITFKDGSVPQGGQKVITFQPAADSTAETKKGASADIREDGTYELFSARPGDGVFYGKYKVIVNVLGDYRGGATKVADKYTKSDTTPFERVVDDPVETFDFEIEKAN
jgi:hypothetical protein